MPCAADTTQTAVEVTSPYTGIRSLPDSLQSTVTARITLVHAPSLSTKLTSEASEDGDDQCMMCDKRATVNFEPCGHVVTCLGKNLLSLAVASVPVVCWLVRVLLQYSVK